MIPYAKEIGAVVILAVLAASHGCAYRVGGNSARVEFAEYKAKVAEDARKLAELTKDAADKVRQAEHDHADALGKVAAQYEQEKTDAKAAADAIAADLLAGNRKLRNYWQGCKATDAVIAAAGQPDEGARLRAESAGRIIAAADEADAQIRGLQRVIEADRK